MIKCAYKKIRKKLKYEYDNFYVNLLKKKEVKLSKKKIHDNTKRNVLSYFQKKQIIEYYKKYVKVNSKFHSFYTEKFLQEF